MFKNSKLQFGSILSMIDCDYTKTLFMVGLLCGSGKPKNVFEYLKVFVTYRGILYIITVLYLVR